MIENSQRALLIALLAKHKDDKLTRTHTYRWREPDGRQDMTPPPIEVTVSRFLARIDPTRKRA